MQRVKGLTIDDFNIIVGTVDDGITLQNPAGDLIYANDAAAALLGFASAEDLLACPLAELMQNFDILDESGAGMPAAELASRKALQGAKAEQLVRFRVRASGQERWSILKSTPSFNGDGSLKFVINVFQDITERKLAEDALRISHEWFSTTLTSIGDAVIATDRRSDVTFLNPIAERITGWSSEEARGKPLDAVFRIINEQTRRRIENPVAKVLREGVVVGLANHTLLIRKDGSEIAIDDSAAPIRNSKGDVVGVVLVFRDVEEKRREEERRRYVHDAVARLSSSLNYEETLQAVAQLAVPHIADWCGVDVVQEDGSTKQVAVAHVDPEKVALARELSRRYPTARNSPRGLPEVLRTGKTEWAKEIPDDLLIAATVDEEHLRITRSLGLKAYIIAPMIARGRVVGAISFVAADRVRTFDEKDVQLAEMVAERAAVALDNARLYHESHEAANLREQLLSIVSHDLRNPLSAIVVAAAILKRKLSDLPEVAKTAERISTSAERMHRLIGQLLDFSRASMGGGLPIDLRDTVLNDVVHGVVDELRTVRPETPILIEETETIRGVWDPDRLAEVMSNLVGNALEHGDGTAISLKLRREQDDVVIEIHNRGEPIPAGLLPHLFDAFRRGRDERKSEGAGLGLYIARSIVAAHKGHIGVESSREQGTRFTVRLPLARNTYDSEPRT